MRTFDVLIDDKVRLTIHVRPTRPTERFNDRDLFIAWKDSDAAGRMAETEIAAIAALFQEILKEGKPTSWYIRQKSEEKI